MLALRVAMRYNVSTTKRARNTLNPIKLVQINRSTTSKTNIVANHRSFGTFLHSQPAFLNGYISPKRHFATSSNNETVDAQNFELVYYGTLASRMKAVKFFSLTTSFAGLMAQPILMEQGMKLGGTAMAVFLCTFGGFFTFVTPLLLHFITKKYVTEMHYNAATDEYVATTISILLQKIKTKFRPSDVKVPEVPGMFTSFVVDNKSLFVDPALFEDPEHYVRIMGYDKPVDFKLELSESPEKKHSKSK